jgi:hypothetical protein
LDNSSDLLKNSLDFSQIPLEAEEMPDIEELHQMPLKRKGSTMYDYRNELVDNKLRNCF